MSNKNSVYGFLAVCTVFQIWPPSSNAQAKDPSSLSRPASSSPAGTDRIESLWTDLESNEPLTTCRAAWALAAQKDDAVAFIESRLAFGPPTQNFIKDIDSEQFSVRDAAGKELAKGSLLIEPLIKAVLKSGPSAEVKSRLQSLLDAPTSPDKEAFARRNRWTVRILEMMNTERARKLLVRMSGSYPWDGMASNLKEPASQPTSAPTSNPAGETTLLVYWPIAIHPAVAEQILLGADPLQPKGSDYVTLEYNAETLRTLIGKNKGNFPDKWDAVMTSEGYLIPPNSPGPLLGLTRSYLANHASLTIEWPININTSLSTAKNPPVLAVKLTPGTGRSSPAITGEIKFDIPMPTGRAICIVASPASAKRCILLVLQTVNVPNDLLPYICQSNFPMPPMGFFQADSWLADGITSKIRLARDASNWDQLVKRLNHQINPKWNRRSSRGAEIQLVRVRNSGEDPFRCWDGDGWPLPATVNFSQKDKGIECVFRFRASEKDQWVKLAHDNVKQDISVCIADGDWKQEGEFGRDKSVKVGGIEIKFNKSQASQRKSRTQSGAMVVWFDVPALPDDFEIGMGAIDKNGKLILPPHDGIMPPVDFRDEEKPPQAHGDVKLALYRQVLVDIDDVDHFVLLSRSRFWTRFKDIAQIPGRPEELQTRPSGNSASAPATLPAQRGP